MPAISPCIATLSRCLPAFLILLSVALAHAGDPPEPQPVCVALLVERDLQATTKLVGTVLPDRSVLVAAQIAGPTLSFDAAQGQFLKHGDPLCRIDPEIPTLKLNQAQAVLDSLVQRLDELTAGTRPEELNRCQAALDEAQAMLKRREAERARVAGLYRANQSSSKELADAETEFLAASRRLAQTQAQFDEAKNGPRPQEIARARADILAQHAAVSLLDRELAQTVIRAPFDGFVVEKRTDVGEWIAPGGPVAEMVAVETVRVRVDLPQSILAHARAGESARVEIESLGRTLDAKISRVIPKAAASARTIPIEIDLPNADHALLPGMFVYAHVPSGPIGRRLMAPKDAVVSRGSLKQVFVVRPIPKDESRSSGQPGGEQAQRGTTSPAPRSGGTGGQTQLVQGVQSAQNAQGAASSYVGKPDEQLAVPVAVTTGMELGGEIEIRADGLHAGDVVVSRNNERLFGPTPVTPICPPVTPSNPSAPPSSPPTSQSAQVARTGGAP